MAWNSVPFSSLPTASPRFRFASGLLAEKHRNVLIKPTNLEKHHLCHCKASSEGVAEESSTTTGSSLRNQLDLLKQLTSSASSGTGCQSDDNISRPTIREQLSKLIGDRRGEVTLPLGKKLKTTLNSLTISQKRNIKRQAYLNEVSGRNDSVFFATIGAFVILPPVIILAVAILTGYVQLFP